MTSHLALGLDSGAMAMLHAAYRSRQRIHRQRVRRIGFACAATLLVGCKTSSVQGQANTNAESSQDAGSLSSSDVAATSSALSVEESESQSASINETTSQSSDSTQTTDSTQSSEASQSSSTSSTHESSSDDCRQHAGKKLRPLLSLAAPRGFGDETRSTEPSDSTQDSETTSSLSESDLACPEVCDPMIEFVGEGGPNICNVATVELGLDEWATSGCTPECDCSCGVKGNPTQMRMRMGSAPFGVPWQPFLAEFDLACDDVSSRGVTEDPGSLFVEIKTTENDTANVEIRVCW